MSRQKRLLIALAILFVLALVYAFWATPRQEKVAITAESPPLRPPAETPVAAPAEETRVRLDLLSRERERFAGYRRDIFNYPRPAPPPPPPRVEKPPVPPPPPATAEPAFVPPEVRQELAKFTFLGFLEKGNVKTLFLSSGEEIFLVKEGEKFGAGNEFYVADLTPERLTIRHREDPRIIFIPLVEQEPLVPAVPSRATRPFRRPGTDFGRPGRPGRGFVPPQDEPVEEGGGISPLPEEDVFPPAEENGEFRTGENGEPQAGENGEPQAGENGEPRAGENGEPQAEENGEPRTEEGEVMENEILPPGGAPNE